MSILRKNILKIIIALLIGLSIIIPTTVNASNDSAQIIIPGTTSSPAPIVTPSPAIIVTPSPKTNTQTKLPQTGIEDYTGLIIVTIVLGASTVFAYIQIKKYNKI